MGELARRSTQPAKAAKKTPAKKAPAKKAVAKKVPAKKVPAKKSAAKKVPAKKAPAKKGAAKKVPPRKGHPPRPHKKPADRSATGPEPTMGVPQLPAPSTDPITVLGLIEPVQLGELRRAWRVFAARHHPDRGGDAVTFARGQRAYEVLTQQLGRR